MESNTTGLLFPLQSYCPFTILLASSVSIMQGPSIKSLIFIRPTFGYTCIVLASGLDHPIRTTRPLGKPERFFHLSSTPTRLRLRRGNGKYICDTNLSLRPNPIANLGHLFWPQSDGRDYLLAFTHPAIPGTSSGDDSKPNCALGPVNVNDFPTYKTLCHSKLYLHWKEVL